MSTPPPPPPPPSSGFEPSDSGVRRRPVPVHYEWSVQQGEPEDGQDEDPVVFEDEEPSKFKEYLGIFFDYLFWVLLAYCVCNFLLWLGERLGFISPQFEEWNPVRWWHRDPKGLQLQLYQNATSAAATAAQFDSLKKWIETGPGGFVSAKLLVRDYLSERGRYERRLEVSEAVDQDEVLVRLPLSHVLSSEFCQQDLTDANIRQVVEAQRRSSETVELQPWTWITLYMLAHAREGSGNAISGNHHFDSLLKSEFVDAQLTYVPIFWDDDDLHWLNGTDLLNTHVLDVHAFIETEYHKLTYLVPSVETSIPIIEFKKWAMVVMSRGENVELPEKDNKTRTTPQLAIMPLIDLVDHHLPMPDRPLVTDDDVRRYQESRSHTNISYSKDVAAVVLRAKEPLLPKSAVTVGYGVRSNGDYLLYHGFTMPREWSDLTLCVQYAMIELPLPTDMPSWKTRFLPHAYRFHVPACPNWKSSPHVAVAAARFLVVKEEDVLSFESRVAKDPSLLEGSLGTRDEKFLHHGARESVAVVCDVKAQPPLCRSPLSVESERAAWRLIKHQTVGRVAQHVQTVEDDDRILVEDDKNNQLSVNQRHAVIARREEKATLRRWCATVVRIAAFLETAEGAEEIAVTRVPEERVLEHEEPRTRPKYWQRLLDPFSGELPPECRAER